MRILNRTVIAIIGCTVAIHFVPAIASQVTEAICGVVVDARTQLPISDAWITFGTRAERTAGDGQFRLSPEIDRIQVRAVGYSRSTAIVHQNMRVQLEPLRVRGLYLSFWGVGSTTLRNGVTDAIRIGHLNAVVIDVKGDRGLIRHRTTSVVAKQAGANRIVTMPSAAALIADLHRRGVYVIARIVVFKDDPLARSHPELAVKTPDGKLFVDREGMAWTDPFRRAVWDYNIAIAVEAAEEGFDEIEFDYVRFPDQKGLQFLRSSSQPSRRDAITEFLDMARQRLTEYNVFLAADNFGYVCWNLDDTGIGQCFSDMGRVVDYICPMLYPSSFQYGIPGVRNPLSDPYRVVCASLERAKQRTGFPSVVFRPWLQAFNDYAFDHRRFGILQLQQQISGAVNADADGWLLWIRKTAMTERRSLKSNLRRHVRRSVPSGELFSPATDLFVGALLGALTVKAVLQDQATQLSAELKRRSQRAQHCAVWRRALCDIAQVEDQRRRSRKLLRVLSPDTLIGEPSKSV